MSGSEGLPSFSKGEWRVWEDPALLNTLDHVLPNTGQAARSMPHSTHPRHHLTTWALKEDICPFTSACHLVSILPATTGQHATFLGHHHMEGKGITPCKPSDHLPAHLVSYGLEPQTRLIQKLLKLFVVKVWHPKVLHQPLSHQVLHGLKEKNMCWVHKLYGLSSPVTSHVPWWLAIVLQYFKSILLDVTRSCGQQYPHQGCFKVTWDERHKAFGLS